MRESAAAPAGGTPQEKKTAGLEGVVIVLVEPRTPGNVGAVCRAMANFGAGEMRLVRPCDHLSEEARRLAVFAEARLEAARVFPTLADATADLHLSVAATRRTGRLRGEALPAGSVPTLLAGLPPGGRIGLVFGREDSGLTSEEVGLCTLSSFIPALPASGSLNLSQAVLIFLYEFFRNGCSPETESAERASQGELEPLFARMQEVLTRIAFLNPARPEARMHPLRGLVNRSAPSPPEVALLRGMWEQIAWSINDWGGRRRGEKPKVPRKTG